MATGTAYYNLTKPASTENYNLSVWNTNLDMIDEQMHQNETETFTGATSLADGTVGNVPAPRIADKDKYLKGDGTWDTPASGGGGAGAAEMTLTDYNALTTQQKNDGTIRFIPAGSGGGSTSAVDMSSLQIRKESAMAATATSSTETTVAWNGGGNIGCTIWKATAIDVTDYRTIKFTATNGTSYNSVNRPTNPNPDWVLQIGLQAAEPSGIQSTTKDSSIWETVAALPLANHTYNGEIDVSDLTGTYYLVINAHGCNTVIEDITLDTGGAYPSQIKYMSKTYADESGGGSGTGYSTTEQDTGLTWIDDSEIYQKTISIVNSSAVAATRDIDLTSFIPTGARVIEFSGIYEYTYNSRDYGYMIGNEYVYCAMEDSVYYLKIVLGNGTVASDEINLTIKYTKAS